MSTPTAYMPVVLVIDDEPVIRDVIRSSLEGRGYSVLGAASGAEAVRLACAHGDDIRLALIELRLPDWGGATLGRALREIRPGLPCGYITWGLGNPAEPLLRKPFTCTELAGFVARLVAAEGDPARIDRAGPVRLTPYSHHLRRAGLS